MVIRNIVTEIPNIDDLGLPEVLKDVIMSKTRIDICLLVVLVRVNQPLWQH